MIWSYPLDEVHYYIKRLVRAGFGKRIMYGTDFIMWPRMIETSMGVIEHAQYLSEDQKRDILLIMQPGFSGLIKASLIGRKKNDDVVISFYGENRGLIGNKK